MKVTLEEYINEIYYGKKYYEAVEKHKMLDRNIE